MISSLLPDASSPQQHPEIGVEDKPFPFVTGKVIRQPLCKQTS
jgi:hypothetical protein